MTSYSQMLKEISARGPGLRRGSTEEEAAMGRFQEFFSDFSEEPIRTNVRKVYAKDVYFNDTLKEVSGVDNLERYLVESAKAVLSGTVDVHDVAVSDGNYYFRWTMDIRFKKLNRGKVTRSIGISHIRFNQQGEIILHQDYWDSTSGLFEHVPLLGTLIRRIKARL